MTTSSVNAQKQILYVGTFSIRESKGIYAYQFDSQHGILTFLHTAFDIESPTFVTVHPSGKYLYAVNRMPLPGDHDTGSVTAYSIDPKTGELKFINHVSCFGKRPCHISIDKTGTFAFVSNYDEGNVVMISILPDGSLGALADVKKFGAQNMSTETVQSHIHNAVPSPDNKFIYVTDLGLDKIYIYSLDLKNGKIVPAKAKEISTAKGTGPRHFIFHPKGSFAYLVEEHTSTLATFSVDAVSGTLKLMQDTVRTLPENFTEKNSSADIRIDAKGKFLYLTNRGHDSIAIFSVGENGNATLTSHQLAGRSPRALAFDATGKYLLVANEAGDTIAVFEQNANTGLLTATGSEVKVPAGVCLQFLTLK